MRRPSCDPSVEHSCGRRLLVGVRFGYAGCDGDYCTDLRRAHLRVVGIVAQSRDASSLPSLWGFRTTAKAKTARGMRNVSSVQQSHQPLAGNPGHKPDRHIYQCPCLGQRNRLPSAIMRSSRDSFSRQGPSCRPSVPPIAHAEWSLPLRVG